VDISTSRIVYDGEPCLIGFFRDITERKEAHETLEREDRVLRELLKSQDRERQLIAYEIHDGLAQHLAAAIMQFEALRQLKERSPEEALRGCDAGLDMLRRSLAEARRLISGLRPPILDESGIVAAIGHLVHDIASQGGPEVEYRTRIKFDRLEPVLENAVYRIVQECLTNAHRYSESDKVLIELVQQESRLRIEVKDWGVGFDSSVRRDDCFGLEGIKERARLFGGHATVTSALGEGTEIVVELPLATVE
jgi:signal transduction histidine kinase